MRIVVRSIDSDFPNVDIDVGPTDPIEFILTELSMRRNIATENREIMYNGKKLDINMRVYDAGIKEGEEVVIGMRNKCCNLL